MMRFLLNYKWAKLFLSFGAGALASVFFSTPLSRVHYRFVEILPGALISLAGFVLAAAAIAVSLRNQGLLKTLADESPEGWNALMGQFYEASRYSIAYSLFLFFFDFVPLPDGDKLISRVAYGLSFSFFVLVVLQLLLAIKVLEDASYISSGKAPVNTGDKNRGRRKYELPPNAPTRVYEEPPPKKN